MKRPLVGIMVFAVLGVIAVVAGLVLLGRVRRSFHDDAQPAVLNHLFSDRARITYVVEDHRGANREYEIPLSEFLAAFAEATFSEKSDALFDYRPSEYFVIEDDGERVWIVWDEPDDVTGFVGTGREQVFIAATGTTLAELVDRLPPAGRAPRDDR